MPFAIIFTKADKLSGSAAIANVEAYKKELLNEWEELPPVFITSSEKRSGREDLLAFIEDVNKKMAERSEDEQPKP